MVLVTPTPSELGSQHLSYVNGIAISKHCPEEDAFRMQH